MAFRAGVDLANLEFTAFHPTALFEERSNRRSLITEAMRGEGARLLDHKGRPFMLDRDPRGRPCPARCSGPGHDGRNAAQRRAPCLYLDVSGVEQDIPTRFPTVYEKCREAGIDILKEPIPVVPAAHYFAAACLPIFMAAPRCTASTPWRMRLHRAARGQPTCQHLAA